MVRCFIGVMLPLELRSSVIRLQDKIKSLPLETKMVESENFHICLSFLGELEDRKTEEIVKKLDLLCKNYQKFEVKFSGIKLIPNEKYIRVIILDAKDDVLYTLSKHIEKEIGGDAKPPHLTLCRVKSIKDKQKTVEEIKKIDVNIGTFTVSSIQLIKSVLQRYGPTYTIVHESKLGS